MPDDRGHSAVHTGKPKHQLRSWVRGIYICYPFDSTRDRLDENRAISATPRPRFCLLPFPKPAIQSAKSGRPPKHWVRLTCVP
jgi:hypothetical protein